MRGIDGAVDHADRDAGAGTIRASRPADRTQDFARLRGRGAIRPLIACELDRIVERNDGIGKSRPESGERAGRLYVPGRCNDHQRELQGVQPLEAPDDEASAP